MLYKLITTSHKKEQKKNCGSSQCTSTSSFSALNHFTNANKKVCHSSFQWTVYVMASRTLSVCGCVNKLGGGRWFCSKVHLHNELLSHAFKMCENVILSNINIFIIFNWISEFFFPDYNDELICKDIHWGFKVYWIKIFV